MSVIDKGGPETESGAEASLRARFGAETCRFAHKNRKKSQKIETDFESITLILKIVREKNRLWKCIKSLLWFFSASGEPQNARALRCSMSSHPKASLSNVSRDEVVRPFVEGLLIAL